MGKDLAYKTATSEFLDTSSIFGKVRNRFSIRIFQLNITKREKSQKTAKFDPI
jgi:hypothetical protein